MVIRVVKLQLMKFTSCPVRQETGSAILRNGLEVSMIPMLRVCKSEDSLSGPLHAPRRSPIMVGNCWLGNQYVAAGGESHIRGMGSDCLVV